MTVGGHYYRKPVFPWAMTSSDGQIAVKPPASRCAQIWAHLPAGLAMSSILRIS